jgi:hypothetical protein
MKYQLIRSASDGDDVLSTCTTYEDALGKVVEYAKGRDGLLVPTPAADAWYMNEPVTGRHLSLLVIQGVS